MAKEKPVKYKITIDLQCGICGAIMHTHKDEPLPKFCAGCGAGLDKFCLSCHKRVEMFFEEWWPEDDECVRTYSTARRCTRCNAMLDVADDERGLTDEESK